MVGRVQICPGFDEELGAGHAVRPSAVVKAKLVKAQQSKRRSSFTISFTMFLFLHIWRHTFLKQPPELLDVSVACGIVYGCHRRETLFMVRSEDEQPETAQKPCAAVAARRCAGRRASKLRG